MNLVWIEKRDESPLRQERDESSIQAGEGLVCPGKRRGRNLPCRMKSDEE
jgi:hypothetical protein